MAHDTRHALVLGAGIMGLSAAWALTRAGWQVRVIDQDPVPNPRGASVDDHRLIRHAYGAEALYMRMVDDAYAAWALMFTDIGATPYIPTGVLAIGPRGGGWVADSRASLTAAGMPPEALSPAELAVRFPMLRFGAGDDAFLSAPGGVLLARGIVAALARSLAQRGVVFEQACVADLDPARASLALADGSRRDAELLVVAAGPWAPRLVPGLGGRVTPSRQVLVYIDPPAAHRAAWAAAPMLLDMDSGFYAVPPVAGTGLKIGDHTFSRRGDAEDPREASAAEIEAIMELARPRLGDAAGYRVVAGRACYYDVEPEERFLLEPLGPRAVVMSGFSGHGFKFGALLGLAVAAGSAPGEVLAGGFTAWAAGLEEAPAALRQALAA